MTPESTQQTFDALERAAERRPAEYERAYHQAARRVYDELYRLDLAFDSRSTRDDIFIWEAVPLACSSGVWLDWTGAEQPQKLSLATVAAMLDAKAKFDAA